MIFISEYGRCTYVLVCCTQLSAVPCESVRVWYSAERNQVCAMHKNCYGTQLFRPAVGSRMRRRSHLMTFSH